MRRRRPVGRRRSVLRAWLCLFALLTAVVLSVVWVDARVRRQLHAMAEVRALAIQEASLNNAVLSALEGSRCGELVHIQQNDQGLVTSIQTDALQINLLKARISAAAEGVLAENTQIVSIPVGSVTGLDLLAGAGPALRVKVRMAGYAAVEVNSSFSGAGVNQTLHRLLLRVNASVTLSMPHNTNERRLSYEVCIAETVIVGTVPELYANLANGE